MGEQNPFSGQEYFQYLCGRVRVPADAGTYNGLFNSLFITEFTWIVGNDENRIADGRDIRHEWLLDKGYRHDTMSWPVSFLEVLIGLSHRIAFLVDGEPIDWAWQLLINLRLGGFHDPLSGKELLKILTILEKVIWRGYSADGHGGFFPLTRPQHDQRQVEIWEQMTTYINENRATYGL